MYRTQIRITNLKVCKIYATSLTLSIIHIIINLTYNCETNAVSCLF